MKTKILISLILLNSSVYATELQYSISLLGDPSNHLSSKATDINDLGQVVGSFKTTDRVDHAFISSDTNGLRIFTNLGSLGEQGSNAYGINNSGAVVGESRVETSGFRPHAFIATNTSNGWVMNDLLPKSYQSAAQDINDANQITGHTASTEEQKDKKTFVATIAGNDLTIDYLTPTFVLSNRHGSFSTGIAINGSGQIAGYTFAATSTARGQSRAIPFAATKHNAEWNIANLGHLHTNNSGAKFSKNHGINNSNQVVGQSSTNESRYQHPIFHAFISIQVDNNWVMTDLGTSPRGKHSYAYDINDSGLIVGSETIITDEVSGIDTIFNDAIIYDIDRQIYSLFNLVTEGLEGWSELTTAQAINSNGQIVGTGIYNGKTTAFILTPIDQEYVTPPICEAGVDPQTIRQGEGTALWWWSDSVASASINNGIGSVSTPSDYKWIYPTETTTYTMTANGTDGNTTTCEATIIVEGQPEQSPAVCEMGADPQIIRPGQGTALWWWSDNVTSASINNGIGTVTTPSDYTWFYPTQTTTYTMNAVSASGVTTSCKTTIEVTNRH